MKNNSEHLWKTSGMLNVVNKHDQLSCFIFWMLTDYLFPFHLFLDFLHDTSCFFHFILHVFGFYNIPSPIFSFRWNLISVAISKISLEFLFFIISVFYPFHIISFFDFAESDANIGLCNSGAKFLSSKFKEKKSYLWKKCQCQYWWMTNQPFPILHKS